ncbi:hypothetical protein CUJ83_11565 [Methanocella sp. CWC-04]|uniref:Uncharacterized protein n=1 Tax=Methanooceanicella nereidis TaxID=2052831 RepID=A0AAP2W5L0_9EURY|nr:YkgJ family cysteine cluster protein [Methanocella sp. CWC-04]MCD1295635.1 hypothetical protein [Methanocella sp. CWC-04]
MEHDTRLYGFSCKQCADCCKKHGLYPVTSSDISNISSNLGIGIKEFLSRYCALTTNDGRRGLFIYGIDGVCPFLSGNMCAIHDFKPEVCRIFPDSDGYVVARRLKDDLKDTFLEGQEGLSRCGVWDIPDDAILKGDIKATVEFRIKEDTDRHYFASHDNVDDNIVEKLSLLARIRLSDNALTGAIEEKYRLIRRFHTGLSSDRGSMVDIEKKILHRYLLTRAMASGITTKKISYTGVRATYVGSVPGIALICEGEFPVKTQSAEYLYQRYGDTGIFAILITSDDIAFIASFIIDTPCLDDIITGDKKLKLMLKSNDGERSTIIKDF